MSVSTYLPLQKSQGAPVKINRSGFRIDLSVLQIYTYDEKFRIVWLFNGYYVQ